MIEQLAINASRTCVVSGADVSLDLKSTASLNLTNIAKSYLRKDYGAWLTAEYRYVICPNVRNSIYTFKNFDELVGMLQRQRAD